MNTDEKNWRNVTKQLAEERDSARRWAKAWRVAAKKFWRGDKTESCFIRIVNKAVRQDLHAQLETAERQLADERVAREKAETESERLKGEVERKATAMADHLIEMIDSQSCERHKAQSRRESLPEFMKREKALGCTYCLQARLKRLEGALRWYGDEDNYTEKVVYDNETGWAGIPSAADIDSGKQAHKALSEVQE